MGNKYTSFADSLEAANRQKRLTEMTALNGCKEDLSDVNFKVCGNSMSKTAIVGGLTLFLGAGASIMIKSRVAGAKSDGFTTVDYVFFGLIVVMVVLVALMLFIESRKKPVEVRGKVMYYGEKSYSSDMISHVECTSLNKIKVHSKGKVVCSFSWALDNGEMFMAWARKCNIVILDKRSPM